VLFAMRMASSSSFQRKIDSTGPKIYSRPMRMSGVTLPKTVGSSQ
jgi:hypothetical protein